MSNRATNIFILLGAVTTFISGLYGIIYRSPTNLSNEISIYIGASIFTLVPFYLLFSLAKKENSSGFIVALGSLIIGGLGAWVYLGEMVFSREASWGFSIIIAPVAQLICCLVIWALVNLTHPSSGTR